jgi:hypothetical protein
MKFSGIRLLLPLGRVEALTPTDLHGGELEARVDGIRPSIPLSRALLCLDCERLFEAIGSQHCPSCGSAIAWRIEQALNRETQESD